ncbi:MFS transporter [Rhodococcus rhodochrous]|uniref:MFS transporter n=1 Tax=Rhodococcus rhodochrous TaxID=1829 RepID=UPI000314556F|nr:MFS transporter [Rhodococcus rhodochrous]MCD2097353.1 MFS transporter [Rhodococcus rhodochrous]MCD2122731.1 MFS transporter [Rhodococcus rhodochrous]MCQ4133465.1 MFS transporter [Rhodococcus rhodochrous]MDJ0017969.1 MFS transporter [Rhodococcus rhodochrous]
MAHHIDTDQNDAIEKVTIGRITRRLLPFLVLLYFLNFLDRVNVSFAALQMNADLGMSQAAYGFGAGLFFIGYFIFEVPSNMILHKVGARIWIARIAVSWGVVSAATAFVQTEVQFFIARFMLGFAEAGLLPGLILYLTYWYPERHRARIVALLYIAVPLSSVLGGPLSTAIMQHADGFLGLAGWRAMFLIEGLPTVIVGVVTFFYLTSRPAEAKWLTGEQRRWLVRSLDAEAQATVSRQGTANGHRGVFSALKDIRVVSLSVVLFGIFYGFYGVSFFLPQMISGMSADWGVEFSLVQVGFITAVPFAIGTVAMILVSRHSDRKSERIWHTAVSMLVAGAGITIAVLGNSSPYVMLLGIALLLSGVLSATSTFWAIPPRILTGMALAAGIGLMNSFANLSGFIGPYVAGYMKDLTGTFDAPMYIIGAVLVVATLVLLGMRRGLDDASVTTETSVPDEVASGR